MMKNNKSAHETKYQTKDIAINYQGFKRIWGASLEIVFRILNKNFTFQF